MRGWTADQWVALIAALVGGLGGLAATIKTLQDRRAGISSKTHEAARGVKLDEQVYVSRIERRVAVVEGRQAWLENVNAGLWSHIGLLEAWGLNGGTPPPPTRPVFEPYHHPDDDGD